MSQSHSVKDTVILLLLFTVLILFCWWAAGRTEDIAYKSCNHGFRQANSFQDTLIYLKENHDCLNYIEVKPTTENQNEKTAGACILNRITSFCPKQSQDSSSLSGASNQLSN